MKNLILFIVFVASTMTYADYGLVGRSIDKDGTDTVSPSEGERIYEKVWNTSFYGGPVSLRMFPSGLDRWSVSPGQV